VAVEVKALPMAEALDFWRDKVPMPAEEFGGLAGRARARAFAVSGVSRTDLLGEIHAAMLRAMEQGRTIADFRKEAGPLLEQAAVTSRARLDTIYRTNVQSAYMAGRYAQMGRAAQARPWWRYSAVNDSRTRPSHAALNGLVRRHDDPFWDSFYPPNGFRCRCSVQTLSERQVRERGLEPGSGIPDMIEPVDPKTGQVGLPVRPWPDRGFAGNVGRDWLEGLAPAPAEGELRDLAAEALCRDGKGLFAGGACRPSLAGLDPRHVLPFDPADLLPRAMPKEEQVLAFLSEFGLSGLDQSTVFRLPGNYPLVIGKGLFTDKATGQLKGAWQDKGPYLRLLARTIKSPFEMWWTPVEVEVEGKASRTYFSLRLLRLFREPEGREIGGYGSFTLFGREWHGATAFAPRADRSRQGMIEYLERQRAGVLLYREPLT